MIMIEKQKRKKVGSWLVWVPRRDHYYISSDLLRSFQLLLRGGRRDGWMEGGRQAISFTELQEGCSLSLTIWQTPDIHHVHRSEKLSTTSISSFSITVTNQFRTGFRILHTQYWQADCWNELFWDFHLPTQHLEPILCSVLSPEKFKRVNRKHPHRKSRMWLGTHQSEETYSSVDLNKPTI